VCVRVLRSHNGAFARFKVSFLIISYWRRGELNPCLLRNRVRVTYSKPTSTNRLARSASIFNDVFLGRFFRRSIVRIPGQARLTLVQRTWRQRLFFLGRYRANSMLENSQDLACPQESVRVITVR